MNKNRHIIGELQEFFANNDASKAINSISTIMNSIRIQSKVIGSVKNPNCKFTCLQVLSIRLGNFMPRNVLRMTVLLNVALSTLQARSRQLSVC